MEKQEFRAQLVSLIEDCIDEIKVDQQAVNKFINWVYQIRKQCAKCKVLLPADINHFSPHKTTRDGLQSWCRNCVNRQTNERKARLARENKKAPTDYRDSVKDYTEDLQAIDYREPSSCRM